MWKIFRPHPREEGFSDDQRIKLAPAGKKNP
jgi:hypothetical protein